MARKKSIAAESPSVDDSWRAQSDLRTLSTADEIRRDQKRLRAAQAEARRQMQALHSVAGAPERRGSRMPPRMRRRKRLENVKL